MNLNRYIQVLRLDTATTGTLGEQEDGYVVHAHVYAALIEEALSEKEYSTTERSVYRLINGHDIKRTDRFTDCETQETFEVIGTKRVDDDYTDYICELKES